MCDLNNTVNAGGYSTSGWGLASFGIGLAQAIGGALAQNKAANTANRATEANLIAQQNQLGIQQTQINAQANQEKSSVARAALAERERLRVAAGESGVTGNDLTRIDTAAGMKATDALTNIETNRYNRIVQTDLSGKSLIAQAKSANQEGTPWWGTGLQIAGGVADFASSKYVAKQKVS